MHHEIYKIRKFEGFSILNGKHPYKLSYKLSLSSKKINGKNKDLNDDRNQKYLSLLANLHSLLGIHSKYFGRQCQKRLRRQNPYTCRYESNFWAKSKCHFFVYSRMIYSCVIALLVKFSIISAPSSKFKKRIIYSEYG